MILLSYMRGALLGGALRLFLSCELLEKLPEKNVEKTAENVQRGNHSGPIYVNFRVNFKRYLIHFMGIFYTLSVNTTYKKPRV